MVATIHLLAFLVYLIVRDAIANAAIRGFGSDFIFPTHPSTTSVKLVLPEGKYVPSLFEATFCLYGYIEGKQKDVYVLFTLTNENGHGNDVGALLQYSANTTELFFQEARLQQATYNLYEYYNTWTHFCFSFTISRGRAMYYLNGKPVLRYLGDFKFKPSNHSVSGRGNFVLGQAIYGNTDSFNKELGFQGRLTQANVWDRYLTVNEVEQALKGQLSGNIVDWKTAEWKLDGDVMQLPTRAPYSTQ